MEIGLPDETRHLREGSLDRSIVDSGANLDNWARRRMKNAADSQKPGSPTTFRGRLPDKHLDPIENRSRNIHNSRKAGGCFVSGGPGHFSLQWGARKIPIEATRTIFDT